VHQDQDSLPTLVALLEDDDEGVTSNTFQSFGRFGTAAMPFLLEALRNGSKSEVVRARYLSALRNIGFRSDAVSEVLSEHLKAAMRGNSTYFRSGLLAAAHLHDKDQIPYAIAGLKHVDSDVAVAAAKLLKELPHPAAFDFLLEALTAKQDNEAHLSQRHWLERQLLAALAATDKNAAEPIVVDYLEQAFSGNAEMHFTEVFDTAENFRIPSVYPILLEALVTRMTPARDGKFIFLASEKLGDTWRQEPLALLRKAASKFFAEGVDIAKVFVDEILPNMREHDEFRIGDRLNRVKDLDALAKSQATNLVPEVCRMLKEASELSAAKLSEFFWLTGDAQAESTLIQKLGQPMAKQRGGWIARNAIIRALGMCGSQSGTQVVLSYLRQEPEISLYFSEETLLPLLRRGAITPRQLSEIVCDDTASVGGRIASISALADTDAHAHKELFLEHSKDEEDKLVQFYAVQALGRTEDMGVIPRLRQLLKESTRSTIRSQSAEALSWLEAREAVKEIEYAFNADPREGYINALAHFQEPSSLPLLLDKMQSVKAESRRPYYSALGAFSFLALGREALLSEFEFSISKLPDYFGDQSALFKGTVLHNPNLLLAACQGQGAWGRLSYSGRKEIARWIYFLWTKSSADKRLLFEVAKRLICDPDLRVREMALHNVSLVTTGLGQELHASLIDDPNADERVRAYAVSSLGYWEGDRREIDKFRTAKELLVRRAADAAIDLRERRLELQFHVGQIGSSDGLARLSSYLCLKAHGDISTPWLLDQTISQYSKEAAYVGLLKKAISERLRNGYPKRQEAEEKLVESRGTVWFD
jgi:HEAT repeat protein